MTLCTCAPIKFTQTMLDQLCQYLDVDLAGLSLDQLFLPTNINPVLERPVLRRPVRQIGKRAASCGLIWKLGYACICSCAVYQNRAIQSPCSASLCPFCTPVACLEKLGYSPVLHIITMLIYFIFMATFSPHRYVHVGSRAIYCWKIDTHWKIRRTQRKAKPKSKVNIFQ